MTIDPAELEAIAASAVKLDGILRLMALGPRTTPAMMYLLGRYVAYEAGSPDRIKEGLEVAWEVMRKAAIDEALKLYGPGK